MNKTQSQFHQFIMLRLNQILMINTIGTSYMYKCSVFLSVLFLCSACAIKMPPANKYKLEQFSCKRVASMKRSPSSILVSQPESVSGYETEAMRYTVKPYELNSFTKNTWVGSPADMLLPLILQSLQNSGYFHAVISTPYGDKADYRLDTQLIELKQNFLMKPSKLELTVKLVLTDVARNQVIASTIIHQRIDCPEDTPFGGVIAANQATERFTTMMIDFVTKHLDDYKCTSMK